jgi:cytochrome c-type biogenesis protein CcmH
MTNAPSPIDFAMFWLIALTILVVAGYWLLRAGAKGRAQEGDRADLVVYADQVAEIERDVTQGRISQGEAEAGRLEIGRRLVKARDRVLATGPRANRLVLAGIAGGVVLLAGGLYVVAGKPGIGDLPFAQREQELLSRDPATLSQDEILVLLQERARLNPTDPVPHMLMGQVLMGAGRDQDALRAFQAVLRRAPNNAEAISEAAGILTKLNGGKVGPDAQAAFDAALKVNPRSPAARFYLGLAEWKAGDKNSAMAAWSKAYDALADKPEGQALIAARAAQVMSELDRGPNAAGVRPMQGASAQDQSAFIASMISSRQERLAANPGDVSLRLSVVRVLIMSGQREAARNLLLEGVQRSDATPFIVGMYGAAAGALAREASSGAPVTKR